MNSRHTCLLVMQCSLGTDCRTEGHVMGLKQTALGKHGRCTYVDV
jgi:hypothetical protein